MSTMVPVGSAGLAYMVRNLGGERGLAGRLRNRVAAGGQVSAILPQDVSATQRLQFDAGGLPKPNSWLQWLSENLVRRSRGIAIFQDVWLTPADLKTRDTEPAAIFVEDCVYYCLRTIDARCDRVEIIYRAVASFNFFGCYVDDPDGRLIRDFTSHEANQALADIASAATEVFISAYDQEGLLVWDADNRGN